MKRLLVLNIIISLFIISCGALPKKEVGLAKTELEKARKNQAPSLAEKRFTKAETSYNKAFMFLKEEEKDGALKESIVSIENSRNAILDAKELYVKKKIEEVQGKLDNLKQSKLNNSELKVSPELVQKIQKDLDFFKALDPCIKKLDEAKNHFSKGKGLQKGVLEQVKKTELIQSLEEYIKEMDVAYSKAEEALALLTDQESRLTAAISKELDALNSLKKFEEMLAKGADMVNALNKDVFANKFYKDQKDKVIADYLVLKQAILDKDVKKAEENAAAYDRLKSFYDNLQREKLSLNTRYQQISQKLINKITGFYRKDAESYLEKARRLKKEVERLYGKEAQSYLPEKIQKMSFYLFAQDKSKSEEEKKKDLEKQKEAADPHKAKNPEDAMFRQLDNLYSDAKNLYEKEEYIDSVVKAKETIELAKRMIALKKAAMNKKQPTEVSKKTEEKKTEETELGYQITKYTKYKVRKGDCLWMISMRKAVFGKAYLWPLVWAANKDIIRNPHLIYPGTVLRVPIFE